MAYSLSNRRCHTAVTENIMKSLFVYTVFVQLTMLTVFCQKSSSQFDFIGSDHWSEKWRKLCDNPPVDYSENSDLKCYAKYVHLSAVKIEVFNRQPLLLIYHGLISGENAKKFVTMAETKKIEEQKVVKDGIQNQSELHTSRKANGTWLEHKDDPLLLEMHQHISNRIPLNFKAAEQWQVLMYETGGHYAPHYDYMDDDGDVSKYDYWMINYGNRIATFLLILETADKGGGTVFPNLQMTIVPKVGDAIVWFNMKPDGERETDSLHGACPIMLGRKVAATLWVRVKGQELIMPCPPDSEQDSFILNRFL